MHLPQYYTVGAPGLRDSAGSQCWSLSLLPISQVRRPRPGRSSSWAMAQLGRKPRRCGASVEAPPNGLGSPAWSSRPPKAHLQQEGRRLGRWGRHRSTSSVSGPSLLNHTYRSAARCGSPGQSSCKGVWEWVRPLACPKRTSVLAKGRGMDVRGQLVCVCLTFSDVDDDHSNDY